jgi:Domain of unknown function (DUF4397)
MMKKLIGVAVAGAVAMTVLGTGVASARAGDATLNVVHGIPGLTVDVCVDGATAISDFAPGTVITGVKLPAGSHEFKVVAQNGDCAGAGILVVVAGLKADKNYTAVANLNDSGDPNLKLYTNNVKAVAKGTSRLTVRHTADAPAVNVWANGAPLIAGTDFTWGKSATLAVPKGIYAAWVSLPGEYEPVIGPAVLDLKGGFAYQVYAWGDGTSGYQFAVVSIKVGTN